MSCGVTVVTETMNDMPVKTPRSFVMQRPSLGIQLAIDSICTSRVINKGTKEPSKSTSDKKKLEQGSSGRRTPIKTSKKAKSRTQIRDIEQHMTENLTHHIIVVNPTNPTTNGLRGNRSPRGHRNSNPAAYPACMTVGICATFSSAPVVSAQSFN